MTAAELEYHTDGGQRIYTVKQGKKPLGFVVIDSTIGGRSRGGLRLVMDVSVDELRAAARTMTLKYGYLGLPQGGAKAGVSGDGEAPAAERQHRLLEFARAIEGLLRDGIYIPEPDIGTSTDDIRGMVQRTGIRITPRQWCGNRSGYYTALSCAASANAALAHLTETSLAGCRVAIEGFGKVGSALGGLMSRRGAKIVAVSTSCGAIYNPNGLDIHRLITLSAQAGSRAVERYDDAETLDRGALLELPVDVLCPCARYRSIDEANALRVRANVICPGANNPITAGAEAILSQRGVLCLPDFVTNCGGVLGGTMAFAAIRPIRIELFIDTHIGRCVSWLLHRAQAQGLTLRAVAESMALHRFERLQTAAANPTLMDRLFDFGLECYRRGWVPRRLVGALAPRYFDRLLAGSTPESNVETVTGKLESYVPGPG